MSLANGKGHEIALDRESPVPLYYQLAEAIRERIRAGALAPHDQLPAERELAERAGISRMTARQALAVLVRGGDVVVRHGVGAFVADPKLTHDTFRLLGFTEEIERLGGVVNTRVLEQGLVTPSPAIAAALGLDAGEATVRIVRLRSAGGTPLLLETSYVPSAQCPGLEWEDFGRQSLYSLLERRYGHRLSEARQTIEATAASDYESGLLEVEPGAPMLMLEGVTTTDGGAPIEWFRAIYRADRVKFALESLREPRFASEAPLSVMLA